MKAVSVLLIKAYPSQGSPKPRIYAEALHAPHLYFLGHPHTRI